jgi:hypothetical protein
MRQREGSAKRLKRQHFTSAELYFASIVKSPIKDPGEGSMFDQTLSGTLRNLAVGLILTAAIVGAGFALAFS